MPVRGAHAHCARLRPSAWSALPIQQTPLQGWRSLLVRLATTIPPPHFHTVRYAGLLGAASPWRARVLPPPETVDRRRHRALAPMARRSSAVSPLISRSRM